MAPNQVTSRLRVIRWFAARPLLWPELTRMIVDRTRTMRRNRLGERQAAVQWCKERASSTEEVIERLLGHLPMPAFSEQYALELRLADEVVRSIGEPMPLRGNLELIHACCEHLQARHALETGVGAGWSSLAFLLSIRQRAGASLVSTSMPFPGSTPRQARAIGAAVPEELRAHWTLVRRPDRAGVPHALRLLPRLDIFHYDSDKSRHGRLWTYPRVWHVLAPGGVFISDDIDDNLAFRDFCSILGLEPHVIGYPASEGVRYIGVIRKPGGESAPRKS
jgi:predicted O-methyltransferase YrrM